MADTSAAPNNKSVTYGAKAEREMSSYNNRGISNSNGSKDNPAGVANAAPMKPAKKSKAVRKKASHAIKRGMISEKAAKRHLADY